MVEKDMQVSKNLNYTELKTIGELVQMSRDAHLKMSQSRDVGFARELVTVLRVLFFEARSYRDEDYSDLLGRIRRQSEILDDRQELTRHQLREIESIKTDVKGLLSDAGLTLEQEEKLQYGTGGEQD